MPLLRSVLGSLRPAPGVPRVPPPRRPSHRVWGLLACLAIAAAAASPARAQGGGDSSVDRMKSLAARLGGSPMLAVTAASESAESKPTRGDAGPSVVSAVPSPGPGVQGTPAPASAIATSDPASSASASSAPSGPVRPGSPGSPGSPGDPGGASSPESLPLGRSARSPAPIASDGASSDADGPIRKTAGVSSWWLNTVTALGIVVLLIFGVRAALLRCQGGAATVSRSPALEVLTRVSIAPRTHVVMVRLGGRVLVLGESAAGLSTLADVQDPEEVAGLLASISVGRPGSASRTFDQLFAALGKGQDDTASIDELGGDDEEARRDQARDRLGGLLARMRSIARPAPRSARERLA